MTTSDIARIKRKIANVLQAHAGVSPATTRGILPTSSLQGKLYEAHVLAAICEKLVTQEGLSIRLVRGGTLRLKQKGGPINRLFPYFKVYKSGVLFAEIFTDTYFSTLSYDLRGRPVNRTYGDYHELDIAMVTPGASSYPEPHQIMLAVECKNTKIEKHIIREVLGFRRELSYYLPGSPTSFTSWPTSSINADPSSVHMVYASDRRITRYVQNCLQFGVLLEHHKA